MRNLIVSSFVAAAFLVGGATAWQANAAAFLKGTAPEAASQTEQVRCYRNAPRDGCGFGWYRTRRGNCRPC
jgi:hypothetical protein